MASQDSECGSEPFAADHRTGNTRCKRGGWMTAPFIIGGAFGSTTAMYGVTADLMQFLVRRFNINDIEASQITNIVNSLINLTPVAGAILCDAYLGCFLTISIFTFISFVGTLMLTLTALVPTLGPASCDQLLGSCEPPSATQFAFLCVAFAGVTLGAAGTSFTYIALGGNQFDRPMNQEVFVNWFFFSTTLAMLIAFTLLVYMMDNVGWAWGYGICAVFNLMSLVLFLLGKWLYLDGRPNGSPFLSLARVVIGATRKSKARLSVIEGDYYYGYGTKDKSPTLSSSFSFINKAALIIEGDTHVDGSIAKPWRLCTTQEVEDFKTLVKVLPLWSTGIFLSTATGIQSNLTIMQSLTMNRSLGPHFKIPAASFQVVIFISMFIVLPIIDKYFYPFCRTVTQRPATILQRIGVGHLANLVGLAVMAYIESRRLQVMHSHGLVGQPDAIEPVSSLWLVPPLALMGVGSAFYFPGQVSLYYQESPANLKNTSTSMMSLTMGIGFYLSTLVVDLVKKATDWLTDDANTGRLDNVYWMLAVLAALNFIYYIMCARLYKLKSVD